MEIQKESELGGAHVTKHKRKTLEYCFDAARDRLRDEAKEKGKRASELGEFLRGTTTVADLNKKCEKLVKDGEKFEKAEQLMTTLGRVQSAMDSLLSAAPESVSMVWFGISSLISLGTMTATVRQRIYSTSNSIATMIELCLRLEQRSPIYQSSSEAFEAEPELNNTIWEFHIPELIFLILDFLWHSKPHDSTRSIKMYGKAIKETFTGSLDQKASALLEHYQILIEKAQVLYEDFLVRENFMARLKSDDLQKDIKGISDIAKDIVDIAYNQTIKDELDRQKNRITPSKAQETHSKAIESRLDDIASKRQIIKWLLDHDSYKNWKAEPATVNRILCIEAPRGHGKSIAMMRICRDLRNKGDGTTPPVILRFFFKKGDQDIQKTQTAFESLLFQLLDSNIILKNLTALEKVVEVLNPDFGSDDGSAGQTAFWETPEAICRTIRKIASLIPNRIYLMIDALDECYDRKEKGIAMCLKWAMSDQNLAESGSPGVHIIISARDTINIKSELEAAGYDTTSSSQNLKTVAPVSFITIGKEQNSYDVREYLKHEVSHALSRLIDPSKAYFSQKVEKIVANIFGKAGGDFTRARLIITHLQEPSKLPLEKKIERLPDSIGDIYMASLEALTATQQELVVCALKWIVWGVSGISVIELSDHYREIYRESEIPEIGERTEAERVVSVLDTAENLEADATTDTSDLLPFDEGNLGPEVKELIYHLSETGRDFFRYDATTGSVTVDISIREWITKDVDGVKPSKISSASHGFKKYRDEEGHTVFKFTLTRMSYPIHEHLLRTVAIASVLPKKLTKFF
ncbi:hypothetical protein ABW20_dc0104181 [Dactylellina cionopaga]|nr:hypothetical protein ABW20_dc0104181 [Dactylellina cionopaga]